MWLQSPADPDVFDDIRIPKDIARLKAQGWTEAPPLWMKRPDGEVFLVTHPVHQLRLRREKDCVIVDGPPASPMEDDIDDESRLALRDAEGYEPRVPATVPPARTSKK
jgi:hypothetical protein